MNTNFFYWYDKLTDKTEPAKIYHLWSAVSVITNILGKKVWLPMGHFNIYPNMYILFVGPAGNRKTTALDFGRKLFEKAGVSEVADTATTSEAVIETMASNKAKIDFQYNNKMISYQQYSPYCSEFNTFLGGKHINEGLIKFLTDIYDRDSKYTYKTKNKGEYGIDNPFFSFLGACTISWFLDNLKGGLISSGFARRIVFINSAHFFPIARPSLPPDYLEIVEGLDSEISRIKEIKGPFIMDEGAEALYEEQYPKWMELANSTKNLALVSYYNTKHTQVFKVAMACAAGLNSNRIITLEIYKLVLKMFDEVESYYEDLFFSTGENELMKYTNQILAEIQKKPEGIKAGALIQLFWGNIDMYQFNQIIDFLEKAGKVKLENGCLTTNVEASELKDSYLLRPLAAIDGSSALVNNLEDDYPIKIGPVLQSKNKGLSLKPKI